MNKNASDENISDVENVAIVGMDGRFPQAKNIAEFWENLSAGKICITFLSAEEMKQMGVAAELLSNPLYVRAGALLEDAELFDATFFGYSPREAELMDPQQRVFLECAWSALENAGYAPGKYEGPIGVYASASRNAYLWFNLLSNHDLLSTTSDHQIMIGGEKEFLTTRVAYKLDLKGPAVTVQTACSSSLVAIHLACQSLLSYQCDIALAGGVAVSVPQKVGHLFEEGGALSPDGYCRAFDAQASGTVVGNGVAVVVLKRLSEALADGDMIHAIIRGSAITNDGANKVGFTAPGVDGQAEAIVAAQALADVHPETVTYIETHGTGTALGDPIEVAALTQAFRLKTDKHNFCALGAVKPNIGHLDAAAGVTGLVKAVLALEHQQLPPSINFTTPNPKIDFSKSPFYVNTSLTPWPTANGRPRRAGVSAFGLGGTNAHVIVEEAPPREPSGPSRQYQLLLLSAKTHTALENISQNLVLHLQQHSEQPLADIAYTYQVGRTTFQHRRVVIGTNVESMAQMLQTLDPTSVFTGVQEAAHRSVIFLFPGGGAQYADMARQLYELEPVFREQIDRYAEFLRGVLDLDIRELLYPEAGFKELATQQLKKPSLCLPAIFITEYALAQLWISWGIQPQAMIGHSLGEYVAACLAGVFSVEDALALVALRGRLAEQLPDGAMVSVLLSEQEVAEMLNEHLSLAAVNGPFQCVVSGPSDAIDALEGQLTERKAEYRRLHVSGAGHSSLIEPILAQFTDLLKKTPMHPPHIPYISNLSGTWVTAEEACDPLYWTRHFRFTVRFKDGIAELMKEPGRVFLEVGPGQSLSTLVRSQLDAKQKHVVLNSLRHPNDPQPDFGYFLTTLGRLWLVDVPIDWQAFYANEKRQRVPVPTYPFERQRYWIEPGAEGQSQEKLIKGQKQLDITRWFYTPSWKRKPTEALSGSVVETQNCWLIFLDETLQLAQSLVELLRQETQTVVTVFPGEHFAQNGEKSYTVVPDNAQDYEVLCQQLRARDLLPQKIVSLWSTFSLPEMKGHDLLLERCFYNLLFLAQALDKAEIISPLQIYVVSNELQEVLGEEQLVPEKSLLLGPCRVIPQEYTHITTRAIDIVLSPESTQTSARLLQQLMTEFNAVSSDVIVAYRGQYRWVQDFEPVRLARQEHLQPLRQGGVYLITGGLGGIGLTIADYLAETVHARLILLGRSSFPERAAWEEWVTSHDEHNRTSMHIRQVQTLEQKGARVLVVSADVTDEQQMQRVIEDAENEFGALHGVIHSAALAGEGVILGKTRAKAASILAPKVQGTRVLEAVLKDRQIDFLILCSSFSAITGGVGQLEYCAANIFLDTFAHYWSAKYGSRALSIDWGDVWQAGGVIDTLTSGVVPPELRAMREQAIARGISPAEGRQAFTYLLHNQTPVQMIVSSRDLDTVLSDELNQFTQERFMEEMEKFHHNLSVHERPQLPNVYVASETELQESIAEIWQEVLGIEPIGIYDSFFELGGHSLLGIRLISRLREALSVKLAMYQLFERPTIASLALAIEEAFLAEVEQLSDQQAESLVKIEVER